MSKTAAARLWNDGETEAGFAAGAFRNRNHPAIPAPRMIPAWLKTPGIVRARMATVMAIVARERPVAKFLAMPHTAWATTATAATSKPWIQPVPRKENSLNKEANAASATAEGRVKPAQAAIAPQKPVRINPIAMPTWLIAGPGKNWQSATRSA